MAKDGTRRGGARPGAGRKKKSLQEKLETGNPGGRKLQVLDIPIGFDDPEAVEMPEPMEYLSARQRDGIIIVKAFCCANQNTFSLIFHSTGDST